MKQVAMIDRGDYWEVIADYSQSPRHAALSEEQWKAELAGPGYEEMIKSQPGLVAAIAPRGTGKWKKDWSGPWTVSVSLQLSSDAAPDFDGVPSVDADLASKHTITVSKVDESGQPVSGSETLRIMVSVPIAISTKQVNLVDGKGSFSVGPFGVLCDVTLTVADPTLVLKKNSLTIRFR